MVCLIPDVEKIDTSVMSKIIPTMWILCHSEFTKRNVKSQSIKAAEIGSFKFYEIFPICFGISNIYQKGSKACHWASGD